MGAIVGGVIGALVAVVVLAGLFWRRHRKRQFDTFGSAGTSSNTSSGGGGARCPAVDIESQIAAYMPGEEASLREKYGSQTNMARVSGLAGTQGLRLSMEELALISGRQRVMGAGPDPPALARNSTGSLPQPTSNLPSHPLRRSTGSLPQAGEVPPPGMTALALAPVAMGPLRQSVSGSSGRRTARPYSQGEHLPIASRTPAAPGEPELLRSINSSSREADSVGHASQSQSLSQGSSSGQGYAAVESSMLTADTPGQTGSVAAQPGTAMPSRLPSTAMSGDPSSMGHFEK